MLSFEPELQRLRPLLGDTTADALIARERREVFSIQPELRILAWGGAMLLATAAGIVLKNNLERIGPLALSVLMALAAAACYAFVWRRRARASLVDEYILLLGALLVSGNVAFIEAQFDLFGNAGHRHFAVLAILHAAGAYAYRSRTLLTLALAALAAWLGVSGTGDWPSDSIEFALRALGASAVVLMAYATHVRAGGPSEFAPVFEHFTANLAALGAFALMVEDETLLLGCLIGVALSAAIVWWGFRTKRELFVIYGFLYGVVACDVFLIDLNGDDGFGLLVLIVSMIASIATLFAIHARFREETTA